MITEAHIRNFKSIRDLKLKLGRVTVLIGENGCGKSNVLEALAFASAAANDKLDNEFLVSRGIRVVEPRFMRAAFEGAREEEINISLAYDDDTGEGTDYQLIHRGQDDYAHWEDKGLTEFVESFMNHVDPSGSTLEPAKREVVRSILDRGTRRFMAGHWQTEQARQFLIYSPENSSLRIFEREGQILPLGIKGEGLFKLLRSLVDEENRERLDEIKDNLRLIDWFEDLRISPQLSPYETTLQIRDRYVAGELDYFDQRSANEGFLFLLFYFTLFIARSTPSFFAIDNIDASLNPKLCRELIVKLTALAKKHDKQVILTTHNPAVLDGLNLHDDEQRLLVIYRNSKGHTQARRVDPPKPIADEPPVKLSEAFLRGLIGGLPQNF
jgi:predicted ATPase